MEALSLEVEHRVDDVLEDARAGDRALLRHVADEEDGHVRRLRHSEERHRALPDLRDRARRGGDRLQVHRLDRVDHDERGLHLLDRAEDGVEVGLAQDEQPLAGDPEPLGPQSDLLRRLLARDVEHLADRLRDVPGDVQHQGALPDPGISADQHDRARNDAAAEDSVELLDRDVDPAELAGLDPW